MLTIAMAYFIFLYIDIRLHIRKARKAVRERDEQVLYMHSNPFSKNDIDNSID